MLVVAAIALVLIAASALVLDRTMTAHVERPAAIGRGCDGFDFPVGAPDGVGYHDAQPFGENDHLGSDWNGAAGGDSDRGDPVFAIADGVVAEAADRAGGWGNVVRVVHPCGVESLYAHLDALAVAPGARVHRGQPLGTIGTAGGLYPAHLHLELRDRPLPLGGGYASDRTGFLDPTAFIRAHRPRRR